MDFLIGIGLQGYLELQSEPTFTLKAQKNEWYITAQYGQPRIEEVGQGLAEADIYTLGAGYELPITERFSVFMELGYSYIDEDIKPNVQQEVVYTRLVSNHNVHNRPIPVNQNSFKTEYDLDSGVSGKLGLVFHIGDWQASVAYRYLQPDENWRLYDDEFVETCNCWWQENTSRDLSSIEFKLEYEI